MAKAKRNRAKQQKRAIAANSNEPLVNAFTAQHGVYEPSLVVDLSGEIGGKRMATTKVMLNRGGTAVDRWIMSEERNANNDDAPPRARMFGEPEQQAIRFCRGLWSRAEQLHAVDPTAERFDGPEGWSQHEALTALAEIKDRVPRPYWEVFENVCRFDEEAGSAGSRLATNSRSAVDAAKTTVAFVASLIAMWRNL